MQYPYRLALAVAFFILIGVRPSHATIFGSVRGIVHDPQHRPIQGAHLTLKAQNSDWTQSANSNGNGEFLFTSVPFGNYTATVSRMVFSKCSQEVIVESDTSPVLHLQLAIARRKSKHRRAGNDWVGHDGQLLRRRR